ncbi:hypothetical protein [Enterococcus mediterraneensis]|uniref:hypothetical protein n=1 Tax=Enterococcus mediterraneensis TaxID=2364791 RepID=UPI000F062F4C|nr:hypothetical protein [Enterococcus mediterraneensis]
MNNRHRRIARLQAQEDARILEWGALQALKKQYPDVKAQTFAEAIKIVPAEELAVNNDWWEDE